MSDVDKNDEDFSTRRRNALFGDDPDEDLDDDEDNQGDEDEDNEDGEDKQFTEEELEKERKDLLSRGYTEDSIDSFITALEDGENYQEAAETYLKLTPDESEDESEPASEKSGERDLLSEEYPLMKKQMEEQEKSSDDEYPKLTAEMNKKKKTVRPENWTLDDEYPSMKDLKKS